MNTLISVNRILRDLFVNFGAVVDNIFGGNFFKSIQYSFSDYVFTLKRALKEPKSSSDTKLFINVTDYTSFDNFDYLPRLQYIPFDFFDNQIVCVNETKGEYFEVINSWFQVDFTVNIDTDSNLRAAEIKHYLQTIFPKNVYQIFPSPDNKIISYIPLNDTSIISDWDLSSDKIFYIYKNLNPFTGKETLFLPYELQPLIFNNGNVDNEEKRNLLQGNRYSVNEINLSFIFPLPVYLLFKSNIEVKQIKLTIKDVLNTFTIPIMATSYTPIEILNEYSEYLDRYLISSYIGNKDIIKEDDNYLYLKCSIDLGRFGIIDKNKLGMFGVSGGAVYSNIQTLDNYAIIIDNLTQTEIHFRFIKDKINPDLLDYFKSGDTRIDLHFFELKK